MKTKQLATFVSSLFLASSVIAQDHDLISPDMLTTVGDLEVTVWAKSPMLFNPTNMDTDKDGRIWVTEGVNYRGHYGRRAEGDRVVVLEDTDKDGVADKSWTFVQETFLNAPMGIAVIDNQVVVSMAPDMIVYTDVDRNMRFDPEVDTREVLLTGFIGHNHDHSLHSVTVGPNGQWYWNAGNMGALFTDTSGKTFRIGGAYRDRNVGGIPRVHDPSEFAGTESDDGFVYVGGFAARMNPDGSNVSIIGHNFRNSYEQTVTSFGDVFQNDNDDPPAARTAFLMEYGNAGFSSFDGQRSWQADRRPGQDTPTSQWRQEDPGTMPPGDVYGGGAPTGIAFYENGALGEGHRGLLLSCEPGRNTVFGYYPEPDGAGFKMERFNFLTANEEGEFAGSDFLGGRASRDRKTFFRPSDVMVGADGAIYVSDWFDPRVGGHQALDENQSGAIYRIAPKGFQPEVPTFDLSTTEGQMAALQSPAANVRSLGYNALVAQGDDAVPAVARLLEDGNPYLRARATWLLAAMGSDGIERVEALLESDDDRMRTVAYRALRSHGDDLVALSKRMANDPSPMVRREVALAMRNLPAESAGDILVEIAGRYDGNDAWYLEAIGTGSAGKEAAIYPMIAMEMGAEDPLNWSDAFADIAWRLHPTAAVSGLARRALAGELPVEPRKAAIVALAYNGSREAVMSILDAAQRTGGPVQAEAMWWLLNRKDGLWSEYGVNEMLKERGIFDPDTVEFTEIRMPEPQPITLTVDEVASLSGDAERGKLLTTACYTCHSVDGEGNEFGPDLTRFAQSQPTEVVIRSIIDPSADISQGFNGYGVELVGGKVIHGLLLSGRNPLIIASQGGVVQMIPRNRVNDRFNLERSLMLSAEEMGLGAQDVADVVAYLKSIQTQ